MLLGIISQCGPPSCALARKVFLSPLVWEKRECIQKLNWKRSLLICVENYQGVSCYCWQNRNRMKNTFKIVNITPILAQTIYSQKILYLQNILTIYTKIAHQSENFWNFQVLKSKFVKFLMSILKRQVNSSSNFTSSFIVMTQTSSVNFKLIAFLLWIKGSHQSPNFVTLKCSGESLSCSSCHFPNHKSLFFQILHHPSVSWKITVLF